MQKSGARFDEKRLLWLNGQWIKRLSVNDLMNRCQNFWGEAGSKADEVHKRAVLEVVQDRMKTLKDLPALSEYFFRRPEVNWDMLQYSKQLKKRDHSDLQKLLQSAYDKLNSIKFDSTDHIQAALNELLTENNEKPVIMFGIIRFALTWARFSPGLPETMLLLGKDETLARIKIASED